MTNLTQNTQNINIVPTRLEADHYQTPSFTGTDKIYNQHFDYDLKRWTCDCPNYTIQKNLNCKHIILLRAFIRNASQPEQKQHHSNSTELINILERIAKLEHAQEAAETSIMGVEKGQMLLERDWEEHETQLGARTEQETLLRQQIIDLQNKYYAAQTEHEELELKVKQQQITINRQSQQIEALIELMNKQAETIEINRQNHYAIIKEMDQELRQHTEIIEQQKKQIETWELMLKRVQRETEDTTKAEHEILISITNDQAQQIDALHDRISSQKPAEQIVRVVVEPAARTNKREADEPKAMEIREVRDGSGKLTACKVGRFEVKIFGNSAGDCNCSTGLLGKQCPHVIAVDRHISSK